jgi:hypothetical protein
MAGEGIIYRIQFLGSDGVDNTVDIIDEDFTGDVTYVAGGSPPVELNYLGDTDDPGAVIGSEIKLQMFNDTDQQFMAIFTGTCRRHRLRWKRDGGLFWMGWVDPDFMSEQYICPPYLTSVHATDCLGELKGIYYEIPDDPATFNKSIISIISGILAQTGFELPIWVACDFVFRTQGGVMVDQRIFEHVTVDWRVFRKDDNTFMDLYSILDMLLGDMRMRIYQLDGHWQIENMHHKYASYNVDRYLWTGVYTLSFPVDSNVDLTALMVDDMVRANSSAIRTISPAFKRFSMIQDYGKKDTFLSAFNLDGLFWPDEWANPTDLVFWERSHTHTGGGVTLYYLTIYPDIENSIRLDQFVDSQPWNEFLQCQTVTISPRAAIAKLMETWDRHGGVRMKLIFECFIRAESFQDGIDDPMTVWLQMCVRNTSGVILYATNGWPGYPGFPVELMPSYAYFEFGSDRMIKLEKVIPNQWNKFEISIATPRQRTWDSVDDALEFWFKFFPAQTTMPTDHWADGDGLVVKNCKWGWVDETSEYTRTLDEIVDESNKYVPSSYEFNFGETPGAWGAAIREHGQRYMHRFNLYDTTGESIQEFLTVGSLETTGGGLINSWHRLFIRAAHSIPRFILNAEIWDLSATVNMGCILNDYSGNKYIPYRMTFMPDSATWNGEWLQMAVPKTTGTDGDGGGFSNGFSSGFDI